MLSDYNSYHTDNCNSGGDLYITDYRIIEYVQHLIDLKEILIENGNRLLDQVKKIKNSK